MKWQWYAPILLALAGLGFIIAGAGGTYPPAPCIGAAIIFLIAAGMSALRVARAI